MENKDSQTTMKPGRGRLRSATTAPVVQRLLDTTEALLRDHSHFELTERKIAAVAGVDDRMIHYYFRDKDGLIFAVVERYSDAASDRLAAIDAIDFKSTTVTRDIYGILVNAYYEKPCIARIMASELAQGHSAIKGHFTAKYGVQGQAPVLIHRAFDRLIACGVYDSRIDVAQSVLALFLMSLAPVMVGPLFGHVGADADWFKKDEWLEYVADLFDRKLGRDTAFRC